LNKNSTIYTALIFCLAFILIISSGCGKSGQQQNIQQQNVTIQQDNEESEKLKKMETKIESLIELLGGPSVKTDEEESGDDGDAEQGKTKEEQDTKQQGTQQQSTQQQGTQQQSTQQQGTQQQSTQQQSTQEQGTQQQGTQQQGTQQQSTQHQDTQQKGAREKAGQQQGGQQPGEEIWSKIGTIISNLHYQWNDFMPDIAKKGADVRIIDNFDNALNELTTTVETKNPEKTLKAANALYAYIPDLYSLYRGKISPEIKRIIYYARNIILESKIDNWEQVKKDSEAIQKSWSVLRNTYENEQKQTGEKLDFSIYELNKVISENNKQLTDIKGRILLSNVKELIKSLEEQQ